MSEAPFDWRSALAPFGDVWNENEVRSFVKLAHERPEICRLVCERMLQARTKVQEQLFEDIRTKGSQP